MWFGCKINKNDEYLKRKNHRGFQIFLDCYLDMDSITQWQENIQNNFKKHVDPDGAISADSIINDNFPLLNANVFISHSRHDAEEAKILAAKLYRDFGLISFIDSTVWNYSDDILKEIDKKYCYQKHNNTYGYKARNQSTAAMHMMLAVSLMKMVNQCDLFIFIERDNSIKFSDMIETKTFSPWLFYEIGLFNMIQKRPKGAKLFKEAALESLKFEYSLDLSQLHLLNNYSIQKWKEKKQNNDAIISLHQLLKEDNIISEQKNIGRR